MKVTKKVSTMDNLLKAAAGGVLESHLKGRAANRIASILRLRFSEKNAMRFFCDCDFFKKLRCDFLAIAIFWLQLRLRFFNIKTITSKLQLKYSDFGFCLNIWNVWREI